MTRLKPSTKDVVIGVSASGMTQFVRGALTRARRAGSKIVFVTCDPQTELQTFVDLTIAPAVGPEVIAGSTRLKAGTATKIVLNMLTTAAMIRIGKTYGNLMVDVQTGSEKRKDRARRIIAIVTGLESDKADKLLRRAHWNVKAAIVMQRSGLTFPRALSRLRHAHDFVRDAIGEDAENRLKELLKSRLVTAGTDRERRRAGPAGRAAGDRAANVSRRVGRRRLEPRNACGARPSARRTSRPLPVDLIRDDGGDAVRSGVAHQSHRHDDRRHGPGRQRCRAARRSDRRLLSGVAGHGS